MHKWATQRGGASKQREVVKKRSSEVEGGNKYTLLLTGDSTGDLVPLGTPDPLHYSSKISILALGDPLYLR